MTEKIFVKECFNGKYKYQGWGLVIRHIREFVKMDQITFGRLLGGYSRGHISRYELEQSQPPIDFWVKMMRTFGLNINWTLTGQGRKYVSYFKNTKEQEKIFKWLRINEEIKAF